MWLDLFSELSPKDNNGRYNGFVWFKGKNVIGKIYDNLMVFADVNDENVRMPTKKSCEKVNYVFARGGFDYYKPILKACKNAYKIYYGSGIRYYPQDGIKYNLILVDTEEQLEKVQKKFPNTKSSLWIKPAAKHFKSVECKKEYDVVFVADTSSKFQEKIKRIRWVYKTVPSDLKVLHLGKSSLKPPKNVTVKRVSRLEMPKWYSACKVGIVPYKNYDSCPRVIPEMLACGLPVVALNSVNYEIVGYNYAMLWFDTKDYFWYQVKRSMDIFPVELDISKYYQENLSLKPAAEHLRKLICGERTT